MAKRLFACDPTAVLMVLSFAGAAVAAPKSAHPHVF